MAVFTGLLASVPSAAALEEPAAGVIFGFDQVWRYDSSAITGNLGTTWREPAYDDSSWPQGPGLLGVETTPLVYPEPIRTPFAETSRTTFYFRTKFQFHANPATALIIASNYVDDGAVFYLNGVEIARVRMPLGTINFGTLATANAGEGVLESFVVPSGLMVRGENTLAVEVHQASFVSSDVILGMALVVAQTNSPVAVPPDRLPVITMQPQGQSVMEAHPASFHVTAVDATNVLPVTRQSGEEADFFVYQTGTTKGQLDLDYNFYTLQDQVQVYYEGTKIFDSELISDSGTFSIPFGPGTASSVLIVMDAESGVRGTLWEYTASIVRPPLTYEWRRNGVPIPGATNETFLIANATLADAGEYSVLVANSVGSATSAVAALAVIPAPVNHPPIAHPQTLSLPEDSSAGITLIGSDPDGDPVTFDIVAPAHGILTGIPPHLVYRPLPNYSGPDSFSFRTSDGTLQSLPATVSIVVTPVNDSPLALVLVSPLFAADAVDSNWTVLSANGKNALVVLDGSHSTDPEGGPLTFRWIESPGSTPFGAGVRFTNIFDVGSHVVLLFVDDGLDVGVGEARFVVITPADAVEGLADLLRAADLSQHALRPLLATLKSATASFDRGNIGSGANQLRAFLNKVRAQVAPENLVVAERLRTLCQGILDVLEGEDRR